MTKPQALSIVAVLALLCILYLFVTREQSGHTVDHIAVLNALPTLEGGDGVAGKFGEPPGPIRTLVPPIEIVAAGGYMDGGTSWSTLRDSAGTKVTFCATQDAFESDIPPNSLYIGGTHSDTTSSRLPISQTEALMVRASLGAALDQIGSEKLQELLHDYSENDSERKWQIRFAVQTLGMLANKQHFDTVDLAVVENRILELTSVDLDELATQFRDAPETDRSSEWERLEPCLTGHLRSETKPDVRSFLISTLGEPSSVAHKLSLIHI